MRRATATDRTFVPRPSLALHPCLTRHLGQSRRLSPSVPPPYTSLPAPCSVISLAALATYLPNPTGTPLSVSSASTYKEANCEWSSTAGGEDRKVVSDVVIFRSSNGSPDATDAARQFYSSSLSALGCHCPATAVSVRSVPGLGDQATALVVTADPDAVEITPSGGVIPGLTLLVTSRNAGIELNYRSAVAATGAALPADAGAQQGFDIDAHALSQGTSGITVTGDQWLAGLSRT